MKTLYSLLVVIVTCGFAIITGDQFSENHDNIAEVHECYEPEERSTTAHRSRSNERSIPVYSSVQRVQEQEKKRLQTTTDEHQSRVENGSYKIVNTFHKPQPEYVNVNRRGQITSQEDSDSVVFPGLTSNPHRRVSKRTYVPKISDSCKERGYCETIPDYPNDVVSDIINRMGSTIYKVDETEPVELVQRIGGPEETALCNLNRSTVYPQAALDKTGDWYYIVNQKENPVQGYRVEQCATGQENQPCSDVIFVRSGYKSTCKQNYMYRTMSALDREGKVFQGQFRMATCCSCYVISI